MCYLSWVGVCWKMCFSYSLSHQPQQTGQCSFQLGEWSQRQQAEPTPSTPFSALYHAFVLLHVPHFPSCNISFSLPFFFLSAHFPPLWGCTPALGPGPPLSLPVSSVLSNGFFRAFPAFCFLPVHFPHIFPLSDLALSYTLPGCSHLNTHTIMPLVRLIVQCEQFDSIVTVNTRKYNSSFSPEHNFEWYSMSIWFPFK